MSTSTGTVKLNFLKMGKELIFSRWERKVHISPAPRLRRDRLYLLYLSCQGKEAGALHSKNSHFFAFCRASKGRGQGPGPDAALQSSLRQGGRCPCPVMRAGPTPIHPAGALGKVAHPFLTVEIQQDRISRLWIRGTRAIC